MFALTLSAVKRAESAYGEMISPFPACYATVL